MTPNMTKTEVLAANASIPASRAVPSARARIYMGAGSSGPTSGGRSRLIGASTGQRALPKNARHPREGEAHMLMISDEAAQLVHVLTGAADLSAQAGLRIVIDPTHNSLSMALASHPEPADIVVATQGARVFLTAPASQRLHGRTLRAELTANGTLFFLDAQSRR